MTARTLRFGVFGVLVVVACLTGFLVWAEVSTARTQPVPHQPKGLRVVPSK